MSLFASLPLIPSAIPEGKFAQNGDTGISPVFRRIASAYNFVSINQRKQLVAKGMSPPPDVSTTPQDSNHFVFRTGANVASIQMIAAMLPASTASAGPSYIEMTIDDGATTITSPRSYQPTTDGTSSSTTTWVRSAITVADGLLPDTEYTGYITLVNLPRLRALSVFERGSPVGDDTDDGICNPTKWEVEKPVTYQAVQDIIETGNVLHRLNGAQLLSYSAGLTIYSPDISGTTETNILDGTSTAWSATSPGFVLHTSNLDTVLQGVRVTLGIYAQRTSGNGTLNIQIKRTGGNVLTHSGIAPVDMAPFHAHNTVITARSSDKVDIHASVTGGGGWQIDAIGLWLYTP